MGVAWELSRGRTQRAGRIGCASLSIALAIHAPSLRWRRASTADVSAMLARSISAREMRLCARAAHCIVRYHSPRRARKPPESVLRKASHACATRCGTCQARRRSTHPALLWLQALAAARSARLAISTRAVGHVLTRRRFVHCAKCEQSGRRASRMQEMFPSSISTFVWTRSSRKSTRGSCDAFTSGGHSPVTSWALPYPNRYRCRKAPAGSSKTLSPLAHPQRIKQHLGNLNWRLAPGRL